MTLAEPRQGCPYRVQRVGRRISRIALNHRVRTGGPPSVWREPGLMCM